MEGGSQGSYWCAHAAISSLFFLWVVLFLTHKESENIITLKEMVICFQKEPSRRLGQQYREWSWEEPVSQPRWVAGEARGVTTILLAIILLSCQDESCSFIVFLKKTHLGWSSLWGCEHKALWFWTTALFLWWSSRKFSLAVAACIYLYVSVVNFWSTD